MKASDVKEAYEALSDDQKRAQYDQFGHTDPNQGFGGGFGGGGDFGGFGFDDIFSSIFGGGTSEVSAASETAAESLVRVCMAELVILSAFLVV